jgi:hypothetical protein
MPLQLPCRKDGLTLCSRSVWQYCVYVEVFIAVAQAGHSVLLITCGSWPHCAQRLSNRLDTMATSPLHPPLCQCQ